MTGWEQVAIQVPIVAAFIWFVLEMDKRNAKYAHERDEAWRKFLSDQSKAFTDSLGKITQEVGSLGKRFEQHDQTMREALTRMDASKVRKNARYKA